MPPCTRADPSAYRKAQKRSRRQWARNSFEAVASEWLAKHSPNWSTGWVRRLERELGREVFPYIGASQVAELTAPDLLAVVRRVEARGHLRKAHTVLQTCGRVLRYAVATGRAGRDVSSDLCGALPAVRTKHFAAITDPKEVDPLLQQLDGYSGTLPVRCALRLAPLVFVRLGELVTAEWVGIDLEGAEWRYTVTKTGRPHVVPLARQAVEILREVHPLTGHHRYAFPNARHPHRALPMSRGTLWSAFRPQHPEAGAHHQLQQPRLRFDDRFQQLVATILRFLPASLLKPFSMTVILHYNMDDPDTLPRSDHRHLFPWNVGHP